MQHFWAHGYTRTSVDDLLSVMGIKKSSFYATFGSKEALFTRCLNLYSDQYASLLQQLRDQVGPKQALLALLTSLLAEWQQTGTVRGCLLINSGGECDRRQRQLRQKIRTAFHALHAMVTKLVAEAKAHGEITQARPPAAIASCYLNALNGLARTIQAGAGPTIVNHIASDIKETLIES